MSNLLVRPELFDNADIDTELNDGIVNDDIERVNWIKLLKTQKQFNRIYFSLLRKIKEISYHPKV